MKKKYTLIVFFTILLLMIGIAYQPDLTMTQLCEKYADPPSQFLALNEMKVHFRDEGPKNDSTPLVLLHGTSASLHTWNACTEQWKSKHRVIRMDMPAFGLTGPSPKNDYSLNAYVEFVHAFLKKMSISGFYLAGNSLGGVIAWQYAVKYPNEVHKLILIDPVGYPILKAEGSLAFKLGKIPVLNKLLTVITPMWIVRKSLEAAYGDKSKVSDDLVTRYHDLACREGNRGALIKRLTSMSAPDTTQIPTIQTQTLVIWGDLDRLIPVEHAAHFTRDLPNDTLVIMKNIGHVSMEEAPEKVAPLIEYFLSRP